MQKAQQQIHEFMVKAQQETPDVPTIPSVDVLELRVRLIAEELCELAEALNIDLAAVYTKEGHEKRPAHAVFAKRTVEGGAPADLVKAYDAILDLMVVTIGAGVAFGLELEPGWEEVHRSNMSKFIDGYKRADGKWVKGPSYSEARLEPIIQSQILAAGQRRLQSGLPLT